MPDTPTPKTRILTQAEVADIAAQVTSAEPYYLPKLLASHEALRAALLDTAPPAPGSAQCGCGLVGEHQPDEFCQPVDAPPAKISDTKIGLSGHLVIAPPDRPVYPTPTREEQPIIVPDVPGPGPDKVCWKQGPAMHRCTYPRGHKGPHQWEPAREEGQ